MPERVQEQGSPTAATEAVASSREAAPLVGGVERVLWLQRLAGNVVVTRLLQRQGVGSASSPERRLQRQSPDPKNDPANPEKPENKAIVAVAERAFAAGGSETWGPATIDIVRQIVASRLPARVARLGDVTYSTQLRQVKPGTETGGKLQLIATDTVVRYVHNGYLEALVRQVEAAFLRPDVEHQFSVVIVDGGEDWSLSDTRDLQGALSMLSSAELKFVVNTRFIRVTATADPQAAALTRVEGSDKRVQVADGAFGRNPGDVDGLTVYGGSSGRYSIVHECGHVIDFQNDRSSGSRWQKIYDKLKSDGKQISSEPKGDPATQPTEEVFAEGFARFHTDPSGMKSTDETKTAYSFFESGSHL